MALGHPWSPCANEHPTTAFVGIFTYFWMVGCDPSPVEMQAVSARDGLKAGAASTNTLLASLWGGSFPRGGLHHQTKSATVGGSALASVYVESEFMDQPSNRPC